jgi:hypothetical protein
MGLLGMAKVYLKDPQAQNFIVESLQIAVETKIYLPHLNGLTSAALLLAERGESERAVELYTLALQQRHVANSRWYADVVEPCIRAAAKTLPPEVIAAAEARGQARDLWATAAELLAEFDAGVNL